MTATAAPIRTDEVDVGFSFAAMGSRCEIRLAGLGEDDAAPLAEQAIGEVRRIEAKYSRYRADSVVSRVNDDAGSGRGVTIDAETARLLAFADHLHRLSGGLFDITSGVLRKAWDFRAARPPQQAELDALLPLVGWPRVRFDDDRVELPTHGMEIDFGGFGKEYAADRAATLLQRAGVRHGLVNLGGDIRVVGPRPAGASWQLAVQHPRESDRLLAELSLSGGGLATSGDYERCFEHEGRRYCHVLDPRSGWPVDAWQSISVVAPACLAAGALTTIAMLKGDAALPFLRAQGVAHLGVDAFGRRHEGGAVPIAASSRSKRP